MNFHQADYVVVGAGSAGCVLANRLSASGKHRVLLLEAGPRDRSIWIHLPIGYGKTMFHPVYNWGFYTDPEPNMNGRRIYWPRGRGLGGSSSINGLIYVRGQPQDYERWAALGNAGWAWEDVQPYFQRSEMAYSNIGEEHELIEAFIRAGNELSIPRTRDFNGERQEGVGYYQLFTKHGWRSSRSAGASALGHRSRNVSFLDGHSGHQGSAGRGGEPSGPPAAAGDVQVHAADHHQR